MFWAFNVCVTTMLSNWPCALFNVFMATYYCCVNSHIGQVGITLNVDWWVPKNTESPADWIAADTATQFHFGWFADPIFTSGDYPDVMKQYIAKKSDGTSRLPEFTMKEKMMIKGKRNKHVLKNQPIVIVCNVLRTNLSLSFAMSSARYVLCYHMLCFLLFNTYYSMMSSSCDIECVSWYISR